MEVQFKNDDLDKLETDANFNAGHSQDVVFKFRQRMQFIRSASDERDFYGMRSLHFEKLRGNRSHQHSMRLNKQWRLIIELDKEIKPTTVIIIGIEDYH
jgi:proteic killer suppression protein